MRSYVNKAAVDLARSGNTLGRLQVKNNNKPSAGSGVMFNHIDKRLKGIDTATKKLAHEETEGTNMISFNEFMDWLNEGKIDDMRDARALRRATMDSTDPDYKPEEKKPLKSQMVQGTRYGGGRQKEEDEENGSSESQEKRGRGRPKGSKSGARH
jgi:hypothetical protein